ncbi:zinc finger transcription factor family protein 30 [Ditylenchus destructor]|nr:zinc finger transcription factor family protein 30 [Ditylenchus destructor]
MPYRTELKRPDLKGQFPCSVCPKIFCHSSSLSRHRMQAHFKSYTCTQCNQEIPPDETLRSHMLKFHQISRMFMCRCCNWAFPDKTSLHIHMQSMSKHGHPGDVAVLARSFIEGAPLDTETLRRIMESHESGPDDDRDTDSPNSDKVSSASPSMVFNNNNECTYPSGNELAALNLNMFLSNDGNGHFIKGQSPLSSGNSIFPSSNNRVELMKKLKNKAFNTQGDEKYTAQTSTPKFNQNNDSIGQAMGQNNASWLATWLANNACVNQNMEDFNSGKMTEESTALLAAAMAARLQQENLMAASSRTSSHSNPPIAKRSRVSAGAGRSKSPFKGMSKSFSHLSTNNASESNMNLNISVGSHIETKADTAMGKLNSVIDTLLSVRGNMGDSPNGSMGGSESGRRNKRKARVPQQLTNVDGLANEIEEQSDIPSSKSVDTDKFQYREHAAISSQSSQNLENPEQPSPAVSDSQTSGSSAHLDIHASSPKKCGNCQVYNVKTEYNEGRIQQLQETVRDLTEKLNVATIERNSHSDMETLQKQIQHLNAKLHKIEEEASHAILEWEEQQGNKEFWINCLTDIVVMAAVPEREVAFNPVKSEPKAEIDSQE